MLPEMPLEDLDLPLEEPSIPGSDVLQADLNICVIQSRSRTSNTQEDPSHQASSTAGNQTPGPSDAPCLMETSTVHDELLLWISAPSIVSKNLSRLSSYVSNQVQNSRTLPLPSPELSDSLRFLQPLPYNSRRSPFCALPTKVKLGFHLVGSPKLGPINILKPNSKRCNPIKNLSKSRSVLNASLYISSHTLCRLSEKNDRGHHLNCKSPLLPWMSKKFMRTLPLDSPRSISYESIRVKKNDIGLPISKISWNYKEVFKNLKRNPDPLPHAVQRNPPEASPLFPANELLCLSPLAPARISTMEPFQTSSSPLTMTINLSIASFVDESSTNLATTCVKLAFGSKISGNFCRFMLCIFCGIECFTMPLFPLNLVFVV